MTKFCQFKLNEFNLINLKQQDIIEGAATETLSRYQKRGKAKTYLQKERQR